MWRSIYNILHHLLLASCYSLAGLRAALQHEQAFRLEAGVLVVVVPLGFWLGKSGVERALLIGSWILVMVVELLNTAIEAVVDRIGLEQHELAGRAKDVGAASVLCAIVLALAVWAIILTG
ncbi:MAG TPA: diacylglycerol kinase [Candidatus Binatia bacterium]